MLEIHEFSKSEILACREDLARLLKDAVDGGASVSYLAPLSIDVAKAYWLKIADEVGQGERFLLVAQEQGAIAGSVQLALAMQPNGAHRAEVQKLLVFSTFRRRGIATRLLDAVEQTARRAKRSLLVLDTEQGSAAEQLYAKFGYTRAGVIPKFAMSSNGNLHSTVFFYRLLTADSAD